MSASATPTLGRMSLLDLICPTQCAGCGTPGRMLCHRCALPLAAPAVRHYPTPCPAGMPATYVVATYDGPTRALLLAFKERGAVGLAKPLGDVLARAVGAALHRDQSVLLVPAPSAGAAVRRRGDDTVRLLAGRAARQLRLAGHRAVVVPGLVQARPVADSAGLSAPARAANLAGALAVRPAVVRRLECRAVVVVDDLVTTGATMSEAAAALTRVGAKVVGSAAIAATARRRNW